MGLFPQQPLVVILRHPSHRSTHAHARRHPPPHRHRCPHARTHMQAGRHVRAHTTHAETQTRIVTACKNAQDLPSLSRKRHGRPETCCNPLREVCTLPIPCKSLKTLHSIYGVGHRLAGRNCIWRTEPTNLSCRCQI